jgi:hypothetical protein
MAELDDVKTCGVCSEPFKNGDVAVQAARWRGNPFCRHHVGEKFWAHPVCLFSIGRETEGPASRVAAMRQSPLMMGTRRCPRNVNPSRTFGSSITP